MADLGVEMTDKRVDEIKERLLSAYKEAASDLQKKAEEHTKRFEEKDKQKRADRDNGKLTEEDYQKWLKGQVFIGKQWQSKVDQMARMLTNAERVAVQIVRDGQMATFADNANYTEYCIDKDTGFGVNFSLYDESTVMLLLQDQPELMPRRVVDDEKCEAWNQKVIANCITQGILQGESIPQIAKRMARDTATTDMKAMVRYARTAMTGAQNSGRIYAMEKSIEQGVEVKKVWIATLDERTRDAHLDLDGQIQDVKEPFDSELGPIMYPGDPSADEANVWNCRCTLGYEYPDSPSNGQRYDQMFGEDIDDMSFDEWFEWRKGQIKERFAFADGPTIQLPKYQDEFASKGYVGLSGSESDAFMDQYHNKSIIGRHGENTMLGGQSRRINEALRSDKEPEKPEDKKMVERLDKAIQSNALPQDMTLYRGVSIEAFANTGLFDGFEKIIVNMDDFRKNGQIDFDEWGKAYKKAEEQNLHNLLERAKGLIGKEQTDKGYMQVSASSERNIFGFSTFNLQIHAKEGTNAYISDYKSESEIILARGSTIRIVDVAISTVKAQNGNSMEVVQLIAELVD